MTRPLTRFIVRWLQSQFHWPLGPIRDAGENVFGHEPGIFPEYLIGRHAAGEEIENQGDPDAMSSNARLAEADVGIDADPV